MLLPTHFRKKPVKLSQNPDCVPMEIQFFGAVGQTQEAFALDCVEINDTAYNMTEHVMSGYDCEIKLLDSNKEITSVQNFKIDQLKVAEDSISPHTIVSIPSTITNLAKFEGLTLIRVTDSSIQLQKISGVSITLKRNAAETDWTFSNATIQGLEATVSKEDKQITDALFGNTQIPSYYYRSCLLSPKFFPIINK